MGPSRDGFYRTLDTCGILVDFPFKAKQGSNVSDKFGKAIEMLWEELASAR